MGDAEAVPVGKDVAVSVGVGVCVVDNEGVGNGVRVGTTVPLVVGVTVHSMTTVNPRELLGTCIKTTFSRKSNLQLEHSCMQHEAKHLDHITTGWGCGRHGSQQQGLGASQIRLHERILSGSGSGRCYGTT